MSAQRNLNGRFSNRERQQRVESAAAGQLRSVGCQNVRPEAAGRAYHKSIDFRETDLKYVLEAKAERAG
jgi:hypothetical protein